MAERLASAPGRKVVARFAGRLAVSVVLIAAVTYGLDYGILRYRVATNGGAYGTVTVRPYYAVPRKDHSIEFLFQDPQDQTCVHALFAHLGDSPCWYLSKHPDQPIKLP